MKQFTKIFSLFVSLYLLTACQTIPPPDELVNAREAVDNAETEDVDDLMPRSMELATQQLATAEALWDSSKSASEDERLEESSAMREESIKLATSAKNIADTGVSIKSRLATWDGDPQQFADMQYRADSAESLATRVQELENNAGKSPDRVVISENVVNKFPVAYFRTSDANLDDTYNSGLKEIADYLKSHPQAKAEIIGYADPRGTSEFNKKLSETRANNVAKQLKEFGAEGSQITIQAAGETSDEVTQGTNVSQLQLDRKVIVSITPDQIAH